MANIDKEVSQRFWSEKASSSSNRWTPTEMFEYEVELVDPYAERATSILDLGSGHGELSRTVVPTTGELTAVDWIEGFSKSFDEPNHRFICSTVTDYEAIGQFDLILLFGVVTCITSDDELLTYRKCAQALAADGTFIVKNQCARDAEFTFNGHSEALGTQYSGRYPNSQDQQRTLLHSFGRVEQIPYPNQFNPWPNSFHVAFVCTQPLR